ncbi:MAG: sulfur carrier protein ThiS [Rickettsiales bacterium]|nr:sulfur carrier protein ThiS [Rickettsiales bacterium]
MQITINGEMKEFPAGATIAQLIAKLELDLRKIAIEINREIISRSQFDETQLTDGDAIEIVEFIGGG